MLSHFWSIILAIITQNIFFHRHGKKSERSGSLERYSPQSYLPDATMPSSSSRPNTVSQLEEARRRLEQTRMEDENRGKLSRLRWIILLDQVLEKKFIFIANLMYCNFFLQVSSLDQKFRCNSHSRLVLFKSINSP